MREKVVIVGAGGHAKVVAECVDTEKYEIAGFLDKDDTHVGELIDGIPIIGDDVDPICWKGKGISGCIMGIGHVGNCKLRNKVYKKFKEAGYHMITVIHKSAIVSKNAVIEEGVAIMPGVVVNTGAHIMENAIINSNAVVEHDTLIGAGTHVAPGSTISGGSQIGENVLIGAGSVVIQSRIIGNNSVIGAGTVVYKDVPENVVAVGNPVRIIREDD